MTASVFGLSIQKLLVLGVVIVGVIAAFRLLSSIKRQQEVARRNQQAEERRRQQEQPTQPGQQQIEDMAACGRCGAYIASSAGGCGRRGCPYKSA